MECLAKYQQMVDPTMVWGTIKSNDAARMDVSFTWKKEEWLIPAVFPIPGGLAVDVARKLPYYHLKNCLTIYEKRRNAGFHSPLERLMIDQYDPFHFHPMGHLLTETTVLMNGVRNGSSGIRSECLPLPPRNIIRPESWWSITDSI